MFCLPAKVTTLTATGKVGAASIRYTMAEVVVAVA